MYAFLIVIHVIAALFLIAVILLQAGRGSGLADTFGGSQLQNLFGTKSTTILTRLTTVCAIIFILTCLSLAIVSSRRTKSLVDTVRIPEPVKVQQKDVKGVDEVKEEELITTEVVDKEAGKTEAGEAVKQEELQKEPVEPEAIKEKEETVGSK